MTIELTYRYSDLDKRHEFGLITEGDNEICIRWIWYYLGVYLGADCKYKLYPFSMVDAFGGKVLKSYKYSHSADQQAKLIANRINKIINPRRNKMTREQKKERITFVVALIIMTFVLNFLLTGTFYNRWVVIGINCLLYAFMAWVRIKEHQES